MAGQRGTQASTTVIAPSDVLRLSRRSSGRSGAGTAGKGTSAPGPGPSRGVQQANFAVLRGSYMPAVLVEIGFGTNGAEAAYLLDSGNQETIAQSIAKGVLDYLDHYDARVGAGSH